MLDWSPDPHWERVILTGRGAAHVGMHSAVTCAKTAESSVMPIGLRARTRPRNHELNADPPLEGAILGERVAHCKEGLYRDFVVLCRNG